MKIILVIVFLFLSTFIIKQDKEYKEIKPYKGIEVKVPEDFKKMEKRDIKFHYPSYKKPTAMYTNKKEIVEFGVNFSVNSWGEGDYKLLRKFYKSTFENMFKHITFIQNGNIKNINGRKFLIYEILTDHKEIRGMDRVSYVSKYTYLLYTVIDNKILVFNFSAPYQYRKKWKPVAHKIMGSISIEEDTEAPNYQPLGK